MVEPISRDHSLPKELTNAEMIVDSEFFDRTDFVLPHEGPLVLPHDLIFHTLHSLAVNQNTTVIRDNNSGAVATHQQFLSDILACRSKLRTILDPETLTRLRQEREVCILVLAEGYEFCVAFFAVLAIGGIVVPLSTKITLQEALHYAATCKAHAVISGDNHLTLSNQLQQSPTIVLHFKVMPVADLCFTPIIQPQLVTICSGRVPDQNKPGLIIFTSGSTGRPKGAAVRRYNMYAGSLAGIRKHRIDKDFTMIQFLPTHHATGLLVNTLPAILGGGCVEFSQGGFDSAKVWERFCKGDVRNFSAVPTIFVRLYRYWEDVISKLPSDEVAAYRAGIANVTEFHCSTSALPRHVAEKWAEMTGGTRVLERYGGTEFGNVFANFNNTMLVPGSVGIKTPGGEAYLDGGDEGEVLARGPYMFCKYINDPEATRKVLSKEGFFRTGDNARKVGDHYFIIGRQSVDVLKSGGYKISALDVEQDILAHPKVAEAIVVGVDDVEFGQRIAAAVVLRDASDTLTLSELRYDLRDKLSNYKLPTILRVVPELPKTSTLKIPKLLLRKELFETSHPDIQRWTPKMSRL